MTRRSLLTCVLGAILAPFAISATPPSPPLTPSAWVHLAKGYAGADAALLIVSSDDSVGYVVSFISYNQTYEHKVPSFPVSSLTYGTAKIAGQQFRMWTLNYLKGATQQ